jgi:hypothetical protein
MTETAPDVGLMMNFCSVVSCRDQVREFPTGEDAAAVSTNVPGAAFSLTTPVYSG